MRLENYRLYSNKIAIRLIPIFVFITFCLFIFIDGRILAKEFELGWKGYRIVAIILLPSSIPVLLYWRFVNKQMRHYTEKSDFMIPFCCYITCLILFAIDSVLVTVMPIKFCGIIGQMAFCICLLVIGNSTSHKLYIPANAIYCACVVVGSYCDNHLIPKYWLRNYGEDYIVYLPDYITIPTVIFLMIAITILNYISELDSKKNYKVLEDLEYRDSHDPLTRCYNRNKLKANELKNSGLIMLDIDHFKRLNDEYGHNNGDRSLVFMSKVVRGCIRADKDFVIRYGGEEFLIIIKDIPLNNQGMEILASIAESIRVNIEDKTKEAAVNKKDILSPFTVSIGANVWMKGMTLEENIKVVDSYLYNAKTSGRNKVCYPSWNKTC